uniref:Phosphoglycolate phosphatase, HAD superfamily n=1 Tax=Candidatus Kentrum sp. DK TaxID=2126562 RepID=A0A450T2M3_9GAMM|nr:MAG: hypothetical protein BECKDK2373B_GA0170837_10938 [Candidatus Kentron sp. DK]
MKELCEIDSYCTLIFDCDGVVLNSNHIKTQAFGRIFHLGEDKYSLSSSANSASLRLLKTAFKTAESAEDAENPASKPKSVPLPQQKDTPQAFFDVAMPYGIDAAKQLVDYHVTHGGISRYHKFEYFLRDIVGVESIGNSIKTLLDAFACRVREGLMHCEVAEGLQSLRIATPKATWLIVSGGDEKELRTVFAERGLSKYFDGGIFGSPDTKDMILAREKAQGLICQPTLFFGDSIYDYRAASIADIDFLFVSSWTELYDWQSITKSFQIPVIHAISNLISGEGAQKA